MIRRRALLRAAGAAALGGGGRVQAATPTYPPVLTYAYDNNRSGWNPAETVLTQQSVAQKGVSLAYRLQMGDDLRGCEAQLLIVPDVATRAGTVTLAIQASMSDAIWAFNADTGAVVWVVKLGTPINASTQLDMFSINDHWGILGTPVIDGDSNILYCIAWSSSDGSLKNARYYAHAVHVADGSAAAPPIDLTSATYDPGHGLPVMTLGTVFRKQRSALLLTAAQGQKVVIACFAAGAESASTNHGWVLALSVSPFKLTATWVDTPHYWGGGIWMAGAGPAADDDGFIYLTTGNGSFDGVTDASESVCRLQYVPQNGLVAPKLLLLNNYTPFTDTGRDGKPADTPFVGQQTPRASNQMEREPSGNGPVAARPDGSDRAAVPKSAAQVGGWTDQDLDSAGVLKIPGRNTLIAAGKDGIAYVLDTHNIGNTRLSDFASPQAVAANNAKLKQALWFTFFPGWAASPVPTDLTQLNVDYAQRTHHQHSPPVYFTSPVWGPMVFCAGENGPVRAWTLTDQDQLVYQASSDEIASPQAAVPPGGMTGGWMALASNGSTKGSAILVTLFPYGNANRQVTSGFMVIYDPENFDTRADGSKKLRALWRSEDWNINFDFCKFGKPVIAGGRIFVPTYDDRVDVYTLTG